MIVPPSSLSSLSSTSTSQVTLPINKHCADPQNEECGPVAKTTSSTGYEPNEIDNFDYSETFSATFQNESVDKDTEPSYLFDAELDDELIRKRYLHHGSLRSEKIQRTWDKLITLMKKVCHQLSPFSHEQIRVKLVYEPSSKLSQKRKSSRDLENKQIRILVERKKEQILAEVKSEIQKHELQSESDRRSIQELAGVIESQRNGNWSYYYKMWTIQTRAITTSRRNVRTESGSGICETWKNCRKSQVLKVEDLSRRTYFILPGLECPDSLQLWRQRREVPRCWEWRRAHQKFAGFTTVPTGVRSKCWTFASLSLWTRKLGVQFISRSDKCRETCRVVFKPKSVESRNVFRQRGFSL